MDEPGRASTGKKISTRMPQPTVAACACPLGKDLPAATATGSTRCGRARSTAVFTTVFSSELPIAVTARNSASRKSRRTISQTKTGVRISHQPVGEPTALIAFIVWMNSGCRVA